MPGHFSRSSFFMLTKLEKARMPCAVIAAFLLKLRLVKFESPEIVYP